MKLGAFKNAALRLAIHVAALAGALVFSFGLGACAQDVYSAQDSKPAKFCLLRLGRGLTVDEKHIIAQMLAEADGSAAGRNEIFVRYIEMCGGNEFQIMTSCISLAEDLKRCVLHLASDDFDGEQYTHR